VVALGSIVYLRQEKSLPRVRRAVALLRALEADEWQHLWRHTRAARLCPRSSFGRRRASCSTLKSGLGPSLMKC
jgi:hypothetical protein